MSRFCAMLDMSRNAVTKPEEVKKFANIIKALGYNTLMLYTEDTYEVEGEPYFGYMRGRYSIEEIQDIVSYCGQISMEVIPCIQTLAHLSQIFMWRVYDCIHDCAGILMADEPRTYELIENMFKTVRKAFSSNIIHIGMDEAFMLGLGQYLHKHGKHDRFELLINHLNKVVEIAQKYGFTPIMWSDMFFRLTNKGEYYGNNINISDFVRSAVPKDVGLVYWDYYHTEEAFYDGMLKAHLSLNEDIWFAGGAWTWSGFTSGNSKALQTMLPAMRAARKNNIQNIIITLWRDNGGECSFNSALPALFAIKKFYDGEEDMQIIKQKFLQKTGEDFDVLMALDIPNLVGGNKDCFANISKQMLYNDPFNGFLDSTIREGVNDEFYTHGKLLYSYSEKSKYGYLFLSLAALCDALSIKYDLGLRTRKAYLNRNREEITSVIKDYDIIIEKTERFYQYFRELWYRENKPQGFDVQDIRLGGLMQRLKSCRNRLIDFVNGRIDSIPELDEKLLCYHGNMENFSKEIPTLVWGNSVTVNTL